MHILNNSSIIVVLFYYYFFNKISILFLVIISKSCASLDKYRNVIRNLKIK